MYNRLNNQLSSGAVHLALFSAVISVLWAFFFLSNSGPILYTETSVILTFVPIGILSVYHFSVAWSKSGINISVIFWFFTYWFAFLVPLGSYMTGRWWYGNLSLDGANFIVKANIYVLVFSVVFMFVYDYVSKGKQIPAILHTSILRSRLRQNWFSLLSVLLIGSSIPFLLILGGATWLRGGGSGYVQGILPQPVMIYLVAGIRPVFALAAIIGLVLWRRNLLSPWKVLLLIVLALITNFPASLPRYYMFSLLCATVLAFPINMKNVKLFSFALLWGGTIIAFFLHPVRYLGKMYFSLDELISSFSERDIMEYFYQGHYAAYEIFVLGLQGIQEHGYEYGRQLAGTLLFWIPRMFWDAKPEHTGMLVVEKVIHRVSDNQYENISAPVYLESVIDIGFSGLLLFGILLGLSAAKFDVFFEYIRNAACRSKSTGFLIAHTLIAIIPGTTFLFWRGSWMPSFGYLVCLLSSIAMLWFCIMAEDAKYIRKPENYKRSHK